MNKAHLIFKKIVDIFKQFWVKRVILLTSFDNLALALWSYTRSKHSWHVNLIRLSALDSRNVTCSSIAAAIEPLSPTAQSNSQVRDWTLRGLPEYGDNIRLTGNLDRHQIWGTWAYNSRNKTGRFVHKKVLDKKVQYLKKKVNIYFTLYLKDLLPEVMDAHPWAGLGQVYPWPLTVIW